MATTPALSDPPLTHRTPPVVVECRFAHPTRGAVARVVEQRVACQGVHDGQNDGAVGEQRGTKVAEGRDLLDAAQVAHEIGDRLGPLLVRPPVQHDDFGIGTDLMMRQKSPSQPSQASESTRHLENRSAMVSAALGVSWTASMSAVRFLLCAEYISWLPIA
eukprot:CAMPEP_0113833870 /NCGR_PEP_ID=MMETSP0328-20130328/8128_1 /TAXON_ID=39455 /ORGANISM="Alexandrium minutum" /LENGTH=160 /DNA_ID=CAMNT_0000802149 /DNA_START=366 /DNA_END=849 /DNA_ORIENTATION=- /assembly_acc=CAM_ASM_000350